MFDPKNLVGKHSKQDFEQLLDRIGDAAERIVREETPAPRDPAQHEGFVIAGPLSDPPKVRSGWDERAPYPWCAGFPTVEACIQRGYCAKDINCGE